MKKIVFIFTLIILIACSEDYQVSTNPTYDEKVDTLVVNSTDTLFMTEHDTILVSATDTIRVSVLDTVVLTDTVSKMVKDTLIIREIFNHIDTVKDIDTVKVIDTIKVTFTDTVRVTDTVKVTLKDTVTVRVSDTIYVSISSGTDTIVPISSSSSKKIVSSSSSSLNKDSSSSIEIKEVKKSVKDSITIFVVDGKAYTLYAPTGYFPDVDPEIFYYAQSFTVCKDIGASPVIDAGEIMKIKDQAFSLIEMDSTAFIGIFKNPHFEYKMIVAYDTSFIYVKDRGIMSTYSVDIVFPRNTRQYSGHIKTSPIATYGAFHACRFDD